MDHKSISAPRQRRVWLRALLAITLLLAAGYWYSRQLRPEEKRMLGTWESPELWLGVDSEAIEFLDNRVTVPFEAEHGGGIPHYFRPPGGAVARYPHKAGSVLTQDGKLGNWHRQGDIIRITRRDPEINLRIARAKEIANSLWQGRGWPDNATHLRVVEESADLMVIDDLREKPPRRIHFHRLTTSGDTPRQWPPETQVPALAQDYVQTTILRTTRDSAEAAP